MRLGCMILGHRLKFLPQGRSLRCACTRCGLVVAERVYETPEQAEDLARNLDGRSDRRVATSRS